MYTMPQTEQQLYQQRLKHQSLVQQAMLQQNQHQPQQQALYHPGLLATMPQVLHPSCYYRHYPQKRNHLGDNNWGSRFWLHVSNVWAYFKKQPRSIRLNDTHSEVGISSSNSWLFGKCHTFELKIETLWRTFQSEGFGALRRMYC